MGHYEDLFMDIMIEVEELHLREEFNKELQNLTCESKFEYAETRDKWNEAFMRVKNKKNIK